MTKVAVPVLILKQLEVVNAERISSIETSSKGHYFAHFRLPDGRTFKWGWMANHPKNSGFGVRGNLNNRSSLRKFLHLKMNLPLLGKNQTEQSI